MGRNFLRVYLMPSLSLFSLLGTCSQFQKWDSDACLPQQQRATVRGINGKKTKELTVTSDKARMASRAFRRGHLASWTIASQQLSRDVVVPFPKVGGAHNLTRYYFT